MFWLDPEHPNALAPGKRPRTTLTPSLALRGGEPYMAFGTPGGDQQDQWTLQFFLNHAVFGLDLQAAIDAPEFHSNHFPSSFYPRGAEPNVLEIEGRIGEQTLRGLRERGHDVRVADDWSLGRVSAAAREPGRHPQGGRESRAACRGTRSAARPPDLTSGVDPRDKARDLNRVSCFSDSSGGSTCIDGVS